VDFIVSSRTAEVLDYKNMHSWVSNYQFLQNAQSESTELSHDDLHFRLLHQLHMCGDRSAHNLADALVVVGGGGEGVMGRDGELGVVPEALAGSAKLLFHQVLKAHDVVLIGDLVHLGVREDLIGRSVERRCRRCQWVAYVAVEPDAPVLVCRP
jgi:hypothetical protein